MAWNSENILSVSGDTLITVKGDDGKATRRSAKDLLGEHEFYRYTSWDSFGREADIQINRAEPERLIRVIGISGEVATFGENHTILGRAQESSRWERKPLVDHHSSFFVQMISRKILVDDSLFPLMELDDSGLFLEPEKATDMLGLMQKAAWCGVGVSRRRAELRIDLEKHRPVCFASKLINGSFSENLDITLDSLITGGIIYPPCRYSDDYLEQVQRTGCIFEGVSTYQAMPIIQADKLEVRAPVYHIYVDSDYLPVELTWFCS